MISEDFKARNFKVKYDPPGETVDIVIENVPEIFVIFLFCDSDQSSYGLKEILVIVPDYFCPNSRWNLCRVNINKIDFIKFK